MNHVAVADVEADMAQTAEDEDVANPDPRASDWVPGAPEGLRAVRQVHSKLCVGPPHEAGAVEAALG